MAFRNIPPNGFPAIPDIEDLEGVENDVSTLKTTTAGLTEDVSDLEEQKANQITIALSFNPETTYEVGDLVYYNGLSYRCTNAHTGEWDADDFAGTTIANELASVKSGLTNVNSKFTTLHDTTLTGVKYIQSGRLVVAFISAQALSSSDSLGLPAAANIQVLNLRDESVGGCVQVVADTNMAIVSAAGNVNFVDGHNYSGMVAYITAQ